MPSIGFGTYPLKQELITIIPTVLNAGYRLLDTAWLYQNEHILGEILKTQKNIKREDLFITSKVNCYQIYAGKLHHKLRRVLPPYKTIEKAYIESCDRLRVDYIDLYLIHYPYPNFVYYWKQMENLYQSKKVRAIGVSNFGVKDLDLLRKESSIIPAVNQVEMSPYHTNKEILDYCRAQGIQVEAFSPFGRGLVTTKLMNEPILCEISKIKKKSVGQVILRWLNQLGVIVIPRSSNPSRIKDNINIFDFDLSDSEMRRIDSLNKGISTVNGVIH